MWNKWRIKELVIISRNEVKKTVVFKIREPDSALVFIRLTVYSSLHFPLWLKNCLNSVYNKLFGYVLNTLIHDLQDFFMADKIQSP